MSKPFDHSAATSSSHLAQRLGLFDATMLVMGGIIGSGIFMNPYVVATQVHTPVLILGAWLLGGLVALAGAYIYAELAARLPQVGGQYAYLREAYHPLVAFLYGWGLLLVIQSGGMAAVAVTFGRYFIELTHLPFSDKTIATVTLLALVFVNCLGVRVGGTVQSVLMVLKIVALVALVACGWLLVETSQFAFTPVLDQPVSSDLFMAIGAAMIPVLFAYGGWQTSNFIAAEIKEPRKNLPRALLLGVLGVIVLYLAVNLVCVHALGPQGLAETRTPATAVMRLVLGEKGAAFIALGITISTLGFLSQGMLTAPRVYFAMAEDGLFFKHVAWLHPKTRVPVVAIILQGALAIVIVYWGRYDQILNYVVSSDFIFFGLTATCIWVFRRREKFSLANQTLSAEDAKIPGHPFTTLFFVAICWIVVLNCVYKYPENTLIGLGILLAGVPVYFLWKRFGK
ncbi:MAG: amino acid permease [candidate division KSB1 bacterium]